jgi:hypothetical protein
MKIPFLLSVASGRGASARQKLRMPVARRPVVGIAVRRMSLWGPISDMGTAFNHLVGAQQNRFRKGQAERSARGATSAVGLFETEPQVCRNQEGTLTKERNIPLGTDEPAVHCHAAIRPASMSSA